MAHVIYNNKSYDALMKKKWLENGYALAVMVSLHPAKRHHFVVFAEIVGGFFCALLAALSA